MHPGGAWPGFEAQTAQIEEGFSLEFHPLLAVDGKTIDAIIKCHVDQVEKMIPVMIDVPTTRSPPGRGLKSKFPNSPVASFTSGFAGRSIRSS